VLEENIKLRRSSSEAQQENARLKQNIEKSKSGGYPDGRKKTRRNKIKRKLCPWVKILVVDDEKNLLELIAMGLEHAVYDVVAAMEAG